MLGRVSPHSSPDGYAWVGLRVNLPEKGCQLGQNTSRNWLLYVLAIAFEAKDHLDSIRSLQGQCIELLSYFNSSGKVSSYFIPQQHAQFITIWWQVIDGLPTDLDCKSDVYEC